MYATFAYYFKKFGLVVIPLAKIGWSKVGFVGQEGFYRGPCLGRVAMNAEGLTCYDGASPDLSLFAFKL